MLKPKIGFIGAGMAGKALAISLAKAGYPIVAVASRKISSAQNLAAQIKGCKYCASPNQAARFSELVFITTPDDAIEKVCSLIEWSPGQMVIHASGARSLDILEAACLRQALIGSLHPLLAFSRHQDIPINFKGITFAIEGKDKILKILQNMARNLGGKPVRLNSTDKTLYHLAAVFASNFTVTLTQIASNLWSQMEHKNKKALPALLPLIKSALNNLENHKLPEGLTGPIARGDISTLQKHLSVLKNKMPSLVKTYAQLGLQTVPMALAKGGISKTQARLIKKMFKQAEMN